MRRPHLSAAALAVASLLAAFVLASCSWTEEDTRSATAGLPDLKQQLTAEDWVLIAADSTVTPAPAHATLVFHPSGEVSGNGGCNGFGATFAVDGERLEIGQPRKTLMSCGDEVDRAETAYLAALPDVRDVDASDRDRLVLTGGGVRLAFEAAPEPAR